MNLLLFRQEDLYPNNVLLLNKEKLARLSHIKNLKLGSKLKVGMVNGALGLGEITEFTEENAVLKISFNDTPLPEAASIILIMALPRPSVLGRILQQVTTFGVKRIYLIHSEKVEKSYWNAQVMQPQSIQKHLELGLEQARDTIMPKVEFFKNYMPYSFLSDLLKTSFGIVLHPYCETSETVAEISDSTKKSNQFTQSNENLVLPNNFATKVLLVGPEGGFSEEEIEKIKKIGFHSWNLSERILKVETAIIASLGKLLI